MEILKQGTLPPKPSEDYRGECEHCHAQVKCTPTDTAILPYPRNDPIFRVPCPTEGCGGIITLHVYVTRTDCFVERNVGQRS
jgi:hypothetical protein